MSRRLSHFIEQQQVWMLMSRRIDKALPAPSWSSDSSISTPRDASPNSSALGQAQDKDCHSHPGNENFDNDSNFSQLFIHPSNSSYILVISKYHQQSSKSATTTTTTTTIPAAPAPATPSSSKMAPNVTTPLLSHSSSYGGSSSRARVLEPTSDRTSGSRHNVVNLNYKRCGQDCTCPTHTQYPRPRGDNVRSRFLEENVRMSTPRTLVSIDDWRMDSDDDASSQEYLMSPSDVSDSSSEEISLPPRSNMPFAWLVIPYGMIAETSRERQYHLAAEEEDASEEEEDGMDTGCCLPSLWPFSWPSWVGSGSGRIIDAQRRPLPLPRTALGHRTVLVPPGLGHGRAASSSSASLASTPESEGGQAAAAA
ncbi:hypothetical protein FZEAL_7346 [Fusarium zealandicum]|uniref:Uncharacterized protein n=1 Tax=Fusarium zealandicum TaxID=1053134 RepID=A0A8H4UGU9_9HYPO|nr:hypothetical protein FZEAL_7346 [Fusarium zealandicum]